MNNIITYNEAKIRWYKNGKLEPKIEPLKVKSGEKDLLIIDYKHQYYLLCKNESEIEPTSYSDVFLIKNFKLFDDKHYNLSIRVSIPWNVTKSDNLIIRLYGEDYSKDIYPADLMLNDLDIDILNRIVNYKS